MKTEPLPNAVPVLGFPNYVVDSNGDVWSLVERTGAGNRERLRPRRVAEHLSTAGYRVVALSRNNKTRSRPVHRVVLESFLGRPDTGLEARHRNGVKTDCRLANLDWSTHRDNLADRERHGTMIRGEKHGMARLNDVAVRVIRFMATHGTQQKDLAAAYGISFQQVSRIVRGLRWKTAT